MAKHPKLENLDGLFNSENRFELTDKQYEKKTGAPLPKDARYLLKESALARKAREQGFRIELIEKRVIFTKEA
ncbi:MAG: hypothetical protein IJQ46_00725 [Oscillospiraceae bacterium]|nr:hypothetical protein [Oscillospiraceae bacterium]